MPVEPFEIAVSDATLEDLQERLARTRWPIDPANDQWSYGVERGYLETLVKYWRHQYDWRANEREMNAVKHFRVTIDGIPIHFIHERGRGPDPIPLVLSHGWPWTFCYYYKRIGPLTDPAAYGGDPADSFDVVVPSLPGYGFSIPLTEPGIEWSRTADLWVKLMRDELGYDKFAAQGGDWGALVTEQLGHKYAEHLIGIHLGLAIPMTLFITGLPSEDEYAENERHRFHHTKQRMAVGTAHWVVQATDPQTLAYALHDSPVGLLAWILDRRPSWSDSGGDVASSFSKDDLITTAIRS
jgi:pimeloyl-ACP methyl ester carboxylesterase